MVQNAINDSTSDSTICIDICLRQSDWESEHGPIKSSSLESFSQSDDPRLYGLDKKLIFYVKHEKSSDAQSQS